MNPGRNQQEEGAKCLHYMQKLHSHLLKLLSVSYIHYPETYSTNTAP